MTRARAATLLLSIALAATLAAAAAACTEVVELHRPTDAALTDAATFPDAALTDGPPSLDAHPVLDAAVFD